MYLSPSHLYVFCNGRCSSLRRLLVVCVCVLAFGCSHAQMFFDNYGEVEFGDEARDTLRINQLLLAAADVRGGGGERIAFLGNELLGTAYVAHTLEGEKELLRVRTDALDCTTFVEFVAALAKTAGERRCSWRDFLVNLCSFRYRGGNLDGYGSRLHYIAEWVLDNAYRGNLTDVTPGIVGVRYAVKTIDFMSSNRDRYPALADSAVFERIRGVEQGFRNHRFPYVKSTALGNRAVVEGLRNGDIVALTSVVKNLDVTHMGLVVFRDGVPYLLHASSSLGKVVLSDVPLDDFMKRNRQFSGIRVLRLRD